MSSSVAAADPWANLRAKMVAAQNDPECTTVYKAADKVTVDLDYEMLSTINVLSWDKFWSKINDKSLLRLAKQVYGIAHMNGRFSGITACLEENIHQYVKKTKKSEIESLVEQCSDALLHPSKQKLIELIGRVSEVVNLFCYADSEYATPIKILLGPKQFDQCNRWYKTFQKQLRAGANERQKLLQFLGDMHRKIIELSKPVESEAKPSLSPERQTRGEELLQNAFDASLLQARNGKVDPKLVASVNGVARNWSYPYSWEQLVANPGETPDLKFIKRTFEVYTSVEFSDLALLSEKRIIRQYRQLDFATLRDIL